MKSKLFRNFLNLTTPWGFKRENPRNRMLKKQKIKTNDQQRKECQEILNRDILLVKKKC